MTRCHLCKNPCVYEVEPAFGEHLPAVMEDDVWMVVARNRLILDVCHACWMLWPDPWKYFPARGFGRWPEDEPKRSHVRLADIPDLVPGPR